MVIMLAIQKQKNLVFKTLTNKQSTELGRHGKKEFNQTTYQPKIEIREKQYVFGI